MKMVVAFLLPLVAVACGGAAPAPAPSPGTPSTTTAAQGAVPAEPCIAAMTEQRPTAPTDQVGAITVRVQEPTCTVETKASDGTVSKASHPCADRNTMREAMRQAACKAGGDVFWLNGPPPAKGANAVVELVVGRYSKPDEGADLKLICAPFAALPLPNGKTLDPNSVDESQRARIRAAVLEESLTSRKWRLWLNGFLDNREASVAALRDAAKKASLTCEAEWTK
jgi:hypothetical protein